MSEHAAGNGPLSEKPAARPEPGPLSLSDRVQSLRLREQPKAAAGQGSRLAWALCAVLGVTTVLFAVPSLNSLRSDAEKPPKEPGQSTSGASPGATEDPLASSGQVAHESKGYIIAVHQIQVSPKVSGMIVKSNIEEGIRVNKGDILAVLETIEYQADYDHTRATADSAWQRFIELYTGNREEEVRQARAELEENDAQRKQLYLDFKRSTRLSSGSALAPRDYEQAESQYRAQERRVERMRQAYSLMLEGARTEKIEAAWADVEMAEADVAKAKWRLDNCVIRAPISGTILTKIAEEGNIVNQLSFNLKGSLCDMADLSDLEVELDIQERDISKIATGQPCRVRSEAFPERLYPGVVSRLMPTADRGKGSVKVRVKPTVPKDEGGIYLKPDMGAIVTFLKPAKKMVAQAKEAPRPDEQVPGDR